MFDGKCELTRVKQMISWEGYWTFFYIAKHIQQTHEFYLYNKPYGICFQRDAISNGIQYLDIFIYFGIFLSCLSDLLCWPWHASSRTHGHIKIELEHCILCDIRPQD